MFLLFQFISEGVTCRRLNQSSQNNKQKNSYATVNDQQALILILSNQLLLNDFCNRQLFVPVVISFWATIFKIILKRKKETPTRVQICNIRSSGYNDISTCRMVFTEEQERQLSDHINTRNRFNHCCELPHECTAETSDTSLVEETPKCGYAKVSLRFIKLTILHNFYSPQFLTTVVKQ